jgi:hypothetical protein
VRRLATAAALIAVGVPAGAAVATAPPDSPPETSAPDDVSPATTADIADAGGAVPATVFDENGDPVATITVLGIEPTWTDYAEGDEPDEGREYVRVAVQVASEAADDETFGVSVEDFILQSSHGFVTTAENIRTAAQSEADEEVIGDADLAAGESVDLTLTFQYDANAGPQSVFYRPDDERLIDVTEIA